MPKQQSKEKAFQWTDAEQKLLLVICRKYHNRNGVDTHFNWGEIAENFEAKTGRKVTGGVAKNKFDYMKNVWKAWHDLRFKETKVGWNETTHTIEAMDKWWERKLAESDKYKRFHRKPVDPELSELWDSVYGSICATGNNCVSTTMDRTHCETVVDVGGDNDDIEDLTGSGDEVDLEGFIDPLGTSLTQEPLSRGFEPSPSVGKRSTMTGISQNVPKRKKK